MAALDANEKRTSVRGLGAIALRVNDLDAMQRFYEEVIGLPLMTRVPNCAFFRIADGYGGHTQVLAPSDELCEHIHAIPRTCHHPRQRALGRQRVRFLHHRA
jgi:catechol 2,3-dioxygenase-like lactoylglutathione lyase family enzyme